MASGTQYLTTYYAKRIIGDDGAATARAALLQIGNGVTTNTWILHKTGRNTNYGIRYHYDYDSTTNTVGDADTIQFIGKSHTYAYIRLDTGDAVFPTVTGDLIGNADTATQLATAREIYVILGSTRDTTSENTKVKFDGSADIGIHVSGTLKVGHGGTNNTDFDTGCLVYVTTDSNEDKLASTSNVSYITPQNAELGSDEYRGKVTGLFIKGTCYGNTKEYLSSSDANIFRYGAPGPQIRFSSAYGTNFTGNTESGAIIWTDNSTNIGLTSAFHFVGRDQNGNEGTVGVVVPAIIAKSYLTIGEDYLNKNYTLYVDGTTRMNGNVHVFPSGNPSYNQGIRIHNNGDWSVLMLLYDANISNATDTGTNNTSWLIGNYKGTFYINLNDAANAATSSRAQATSTGWSFGLDETTIDNSITLNDYTLATESFFSNDWITTGGNVGWKSGTHGGGWYMPNNTYVKLYGNKQVLVASSNTASTTNLSSQLIVSSVAYNDTLDPNSGSASGVVALELWRKIGASWQIANDNGTLRIRSNYSSEKQHTYSQDGIHIAYNTGNTTIAGIATVKGGKLVVNKTITTGTNGADNEPAEINFSVTNNSITSTTYKTESNARILAYHALTTTSDSGMNMVIKPGGHLFVGGGESAINLYNTLYTAAMNDSNNTSKTFAGENLYLTADSQIFIESYANDIENRIGFKVNTSGALIPVAAENTTSGEQNLGDASARWKILWTSNNVFVGPNEYYTYNGAANGTDIGVRYIYLQNQDTESSNGYYIFGETQQYGRLYLERLGNTTTYGYARLTLGNNKTTSEAKNAVGRILLYGREDDYMLIEPAVLTSSITLGGTGDRFTMPKLTITNTTDAAATNDAPFLVSGGVGIAKTLYVGTRIIVSGTGDVDHLEFSSSTYNYISIPATVGAELCIGPVGHNNTTSIARFIYSSVANEQQVKVNGALSIFPKGSSYNQGIRVHNQGTWTIITLCASDNTGDTGTSTNSWILGNKDGNLHFAKNGADGSSVVNLSNVDGYWRLRGNLVAETSGSIRSALYIYGTSYGNSASDIQSSTAGFLTYGDGGPQLVFGSGAGIGATDNQEGALLFTNNDTCANGVSFNFLSNQSDWNVISKRFHARTSISIGSDLPNTSYTLYVNGVSYFTNHVRLYSPGYSFQIYNSDLTNLDATNNGLTANRAHGYNFYSNNGTWTGGYEQVYNYDTNAHYVASRIYARNHKIDGSNVNNYLILYANKDGTVTYSVANKANFRAAIDAKPLQSAKSDPTASGSGITYIATISQDADGVITATKSTVRSASADQSGVVTTGTQTFAGSKTFSSKITGSITGNCDGTANKATNDVDGNAIKTTYAKLAAANTFTGDITVQKASGAVYITAKRTDTTLATYVHINSSSTNHGLYSNGWYDGTTFHSEGQWLVYRNNAGTITVNGNCTGNAATATTATRIFNRTSLTKGTNPSEIKYQTTAFHYESGTGTDVANRVGGGIESSVDANGSTSLYLRVYRYASGSTDQNVLTITCAKNGDCSYSVSDKAAFRSAINAKPTQDAVSVSGTSGITFVHSITQNANGVVSASTSTVRSASADQSGIVTTETQTFAGSKTFSSKITGSITGNCDGTANKATNDVDGNAIKTTYAKLTGAIFSGNVGRKNTSVNLKNAANGLSEDSAISSFYTSDNNNYTYAIFEGVAVPDGRVYAYMGACNRDTSGTSQGWKGLAVYADKAGNCTYGVSDKAAFRTAIGVGASGTHADTYFVQRSGDTMSGNLTVSLAKGTENHFIARATGYTDSKNLDIKLMVGSGKVNHGLYSTGYSADGTAFTASGKWMIYRNSAGTIVVNGNCTGSSGSCSGNAATATTLANPREIYVALGSTRDTNNKVTFDGSAAKAIHVSGTLPIARGGTGATSAADAWTALGGGASGKHADSYFALASHSHAYLPSDGGAMTGAIRFDGKGSCSIYNGPNDAANTAGGNLGNLVISSWFGVSFTTSCSNQDCTGKNAFSINCRTGYAYAKRMYNAVWNDYAEYRQTTTEEPGRVCQEQDDGCMILADKRLIPGCSVISDTYGYSEGETEKAKTPTAVSGRVLAYTYRPREEYHAGMAVCSAPDGTIDIMSRDEIMMYPDAIIGIVSEIPDYEEWGSGNVKVNGRIWIKIK